MRSARDVSSLTPLPFRLPWCTATAAQVGMHLRHAKTALLALRHLTCWTSWHVCLERCVPRRLDAREMGGLDKSSLRSLPPV